MALTAKHPIVLHHKGKRREIKAGQALPADLGDDQVKTLRQYGAIEEATTTPVPSPALAKPATNVK